jgi:hypothetical protein
MRATNRRRNAFLSGLFGAVGRWTGVPQTAFAALLLLSAGNLAWLRLTVMQLRQATLSVAPAQLPRAPVAEQASV